VKIWVEALTPKQILLFSYIQDIFGRQNVFLTTRDYDLNANLASKRWSRHFLVGRYPGASSIAKTRESIKRQEKLIDIVSSEKPDVHLTFVSPDSVRVAFGLGIPVITSSDSPHSDAVSRLTIPLSRIFVTPYFLLEDFEKYNRLVEVVGFEGVFELAWILREKPDPKVPRELGLEPFSYALVRPGEEKSYYYPSPAFATRMPLSIARMILRRTDLTVIVYPRYPDQALLYRRLLSRWNNRVKILEGATDFVSLEYHARLVITGGGTMATESALLGTPSISTYPGELKVHKFIRKRGFPLYKAPLPQSFIEKLLLLETGPGERERYIQRAKKTLQDPISVFAREITRIINRNEN
jgi:predicted glycosyltransferase